MNDSLRQCLTSHKILVCCGTGGVGKTTTSAALALAAAEEGLRAIVITIDPARRLATSLGLKSLSNEPQDLTSHVNEVFKSKGIAPLKGQLHAVMPDTEKTFEQFVRSVSSGQEHLATRVLKTSIYKIFTQDFAGAHEYMAMEKLFQLWQKVQKKEIDLIILDTPPSANTRFFLEAPHLLGDFFDERIMKWLHAPGGKLLTAGVHKLLEILERLTGKGFIADLLDFTAALFELRTQFMDNLKSVEDLLHSKDVAFLMVTSPERLVRADTLDFVTLLKDRNFHFWGFMINRMLGPKLGVQESTLQKPWVTGLTPPLSVAEAGSLEKNYHSLQSRLYHEEEALKFLKNMKVNLALVPEQNTDVHSMGALHELCQSL